MLCRFVRKQFQVLFHWASRPSFRLSFSVLVHYRYLPIFSLGGWFPLLPTKYLRRSTWEIPTPHQNFVYQTFTVYGVPFQALLLFWRVRHWAPATPHEASCEAKWGLGSFAFALRYWRNHVYFLFLTLLRCFSSGGSRNCSYASCAKAIIFITIIIL